MLRTTANTSKRLCATCRLRLGRFMVSQPARQLSSLPTSSSRGTHTALHLIPIYRSFSSARIVAAPKVESSIKKRKVDMEQFPPERIRNLSIIAHIDHGKSTLADRLLQMTNTLPPSSNPQFLDKLKVERERGITVKAQTVSIIHTHTDGHKYLINLIDTPGHVDFSYEVSRSLGACEGGLLLVDSTQGIQAQTLSVFHHALEADLKLLAVINKVDLPHASPAETSQQITTTLGLTDDPHMHISAKSGLGVDNVLAQIVEGLPCPAPWVEDDGKLRGLVFDHFYDHFRGVVALVRLFSGTIKKGDKIRFLQSDRKYEVLEVGIQNPEEVLVDTLKEGQVGYVVCNMKNSEDAFIGDTICWADQLVDALPGFQPMKAMVYAGLFPIDAGEFPKLEEAIERLTLNDRSVTIQRESSAALSQGFRLGFLGTLHMDVFRQRLEDEYDSNVIVTAPTVPYKVKLRNGTESFISNPADFPDVTDPKARVAGVEEPMVNATIFVPNEYIGEMMDLCSRYRGVQHEYKVVEGSDRAILKYTLPLAEIVTDFFSDLKSASSGFASFDYDEAGYEASDLVKLNMMLNGKPVDALAMIVHRSAAQLIGRAWTKKLRDVLPRQLFEVAIQAAIGTKVVARETLSAMRKDVTAGLYGGHYERKLKHLNKQKEGKKRLKKLAGNIDIPQSAFFDVLSSRPRTFSTSIRRLTPQTETVQGDIVLDHLPVDLPPPAIDLDTPPRVGSPFHPTGVSTQERSEKLSKLHGLLAEKFLDPQAIIDTFNDIQASGSSTRSPTLTPPELNSILRALNQVDKRAIHRVRDNKSEISKIHHQLDLVSERAHKGLEQAILGSLVDSARSAGPQLKEVENQMSRLFPRPPKMDDALAIKRYRSCVNYMLQLYALAGDVEGFERWRSRLSALGAEEDSYSALAKVTLASKAGDSTTIIRTLEDMLAKVVAPDQQMILVNFALWSLAIKGHWQTVLPIYQRLVPTSSVRLDPPTMVSGAESISIPSGLVATSQTFSLLIHSLSHQGQFESALTVLQTMVELGHQPHIPEYMSLFKGFARHGVVPDTKAGRLATAFPLWERFDTRTQQTSGPISRGQSISDIWKRSNTASLNGNEIDRNATPDSKGGWTITNLQDIFSSFLQLSPSKEMNQAPTPSQTWTVMMAFARTTNADDETVCSVWERLEGKFSNEEWWGWRLDGRLRRLVGRMRQGEEEREW